MDCNKDEAMRAKQIAESRMQNGDFVGALKFAIKAQKLLPAIENIAQILAVCEVHCAAQKKLSGSEMDWYGILQTEQLADEATIRKQYRKLALLLHPDKNKFSGAEAAFKLIGEANRVLSDQAKRSLYDMKYRALQRTAAAKLPSHHSNGNIYANKHDIMSGNYQNNSYSQSHRQTAQQTFWTACQHCNTRYQYYKAIVNATLRCQQCSRPFIAHDLGFHGVPPGYRRPSFNNQKEYPMYGPPKSASEINGGKPFSERQEGNFVQSESMTKCTVGVGGHRKGEKSKDGYVAAGGANVDVGPSKHASAKTRESQTSTYVGSKRARQSVPDSRQSCKTENGNGLKDANARENGVDPSGLNAGVQPRRSSRQKQHVSYFETSHGDGFESPSKRPRRNESSNTIEVEKREIPASGRFFNHNSSASSAAGMGGQNREQRNKASDLPEEVFLQRKSKIEQSRVHQEEASKSDLHDTNTKADHCSPLNSNVPSNPDIISCPDPDFSDFDKDRAENCFAINQFWAIYDPSDSMPRFYALIKKVLSPGFKLLITWLEAEPDDQGEIDWHDAELPVACGKFKLGAFQEIEDRAMFSHKMHCVKGSGRRHYLVYPRKGETWAIFRDWNIGWSSNPEKHSNYEFEYVEVLSDFTDNVGIEVTYLGKVKGFVSLFKQTEHNGIGLFCVPPNQLYRFSHRIPSFKMTGDEREGVPQGSFELDPAGLPMDLFDLGDLKMGDGMLNSGVSSSCHESSEHKVEQVMANETSHDAKMHESNEVERASSILRRSPRGSNRKNLDNSKVNRSQYMTRENGGKDMGHKDLSQPEGTNESGHEAKIHESNDAERVSSILRRSRRGSIRKNMENGQVNKSQDMIGEDGSKDIGHREFSQPEGTAPPASQADERVKTPKKHEKNDCEGERLKVRRSPRDLSKKKSQDADQCTTGEVSGEHLDGNKKLKDGSFSQSVGSVCRPFPEDCRVPKASCYDFNMEKSQEKFQRDQIWALYGDREGMPDIYAQIKEVEFTPNFRLRVALLEPFSSPKGRNRPASCGTFTVKNAKTQILSRSAFSHQLKVEPVANNRFEIYPRKGEIWALYKDQNYESTDSNQGRGDCHIVEVLADSDKSLQVVVLVRHSDSKSIYMAPRAQRSKTGIIEIPREDAYRFSHQIPAFWHLGEDNVHLRGCWELDPSSIPGFVIHLD